MVLIWSWSVQIFSNIHGSGWFNDSAGRVGSKSDPWTTLGEAREKRIVRSIGFGIWGVGKLHLRLRAESCNEAEDQEKMGRDLGN